MYKAKPKLEIETNDTTDADLEWLAQNEAPTEEGEQLNKSTLINRAVQLYAHLARERAAGRNIFLETGDLNTLQKMDWE